MATTDHPAQDRLFHGTKVDLKQGDLIEGDAVFMTDTLDAAAWQSELAPGEGPGRIYPVEPTGSITEAGDETDERYPTYIGTWFRSSEPVRVTGEVTDRQGRPPRLYHGTKADLQVGDLIGPGYPSNFGEPDRTMTYVYLTGTLDAATWGAELAMGEGPGRIYVVEPTGSIADDPDLTDKRYPGNPTKSYRSREPLRVTGEVTEWQGHPAEALEAMKKGLERRRHEATNEP